ncbi:DUF4160 domain-containing protein [Mesorhizobium jarvisii]|uniref:DUF4160 domain-containing protein n=1 Tax=Mesorhizobium jarvisii TaxID=1777867 RepID=UPI000A00F813|nr:DUF4160 domain-containing protein [Mesorhizobium jarvisii]MCH4560852.1 DUF4160 domain-containing protein [Mesorhizobium jarvisii]QGU20875.1 DUF4160 domain-containing protein [Mesorhizobium huakuii 7653R]
MTYYSVELDRDLSDELEAFFVRTGPGGYFVKHFVGLVDGKLRAEVRANEHPPPHFHITYDGEDASFDLGTGRRLPGVRGLDRYDPTVHVWWKRNRVKIVAKWNSSRPSDCPVGVMELPANWS